MEDRDAAAIDDTPDKTAGARRTPLLASVLEHVDAHRCFNRGQGMTGAPARRKQAALTPLGARKDDAARHTPRMGSSGAQGNAEPGSSEGTSRSLEPLLSTKKRPLKKDPRRGKGRPIQADGPLGMNPRPHPALEVGVSRSGVRSGIMAWERGRPRPLGQEAAPGDERGPRGVGRRSVQRQAQAAFPNASPC